MKYLLLVLVLLSFNANSQQTVLCRSINTDTVDVYVYKIIYHITNDSVYIDDLAPTNITAYYNGALEYELELDLNDFYLVFFVNPLNDISKDMYIQTGPKSLDKPLVFTADFNTLYSLCVSYDPENKMYESKKLIIPKSMF